jgi:hypothetical protein
MKHMNRLALLLGLLSATGVSVADSSKSSDVGASCRQETRRHAVWPIGTKAQQFARFAEREVTVCDGKVVTRTAATEARPAKE